MSEAEYDTNLQYDGHDPFDGCTSNIEQLLAENAELKAEVKWLKEALVRVAAFYGQDVFIVREIAAQALAPKPGKTS